MPHFAFPGTLAHTPYAGFTQELFDDFPVAIWQIAELERQQRVFPDHGGAEPGAKSQKQHSSAMVTSERLHRGVINDHRRFVQCLTKIVPGPAWPEMLGVTHD